MTKRNLIKITFSAAVLAAAIFLTGCPKDPKGTGPVPNISFDISNAEALAGIAKTQNRSARAADPNALLQKFFDDGTVDAAMDMDGNPFGEHLSYVDYVVLPPKDVDSKDVYLLMEDYSWTYVNVDGHKEFWVLSPLLCIHEDNSYDDVLLPSPFTNSFPYVIDYKENLQFLKDGSLVYLCRTGVADKYFMKKWDPKTNETTDICTIPLKENEESILIERFSIDKSEDFIYMKVETVNNDGTGSNYLQISQISNPDFYYSLNGVTGWCYSPYDDSLYYSRYYSEEDDTQGLFKADKTGSNPEQLSTAMFRYLIPESAQKIWGQNGYTETELEIQNILSEKLENTLYDKAFTEKISYTAPEYYYFWGDYISKNNTLYFMHSHVDSTMRHEDAIIAIPTNDPNSEPQNLLEFNQHIQLHSWDVNENSLFIVGVDYETREPINYKIDLKTGEQIPIQSDSEFNAIAALE